MSELSESETHKRIRMAVVRLEKGKPMVVEKGRKVSVAAVAEEAGVSRALIHRDYPDLMERIRGNANKVIQKQRDDKQLRLKQERFKNRQLRQKIVELTEQRNELASKNATLQLENRRLSAILESKSVTMFRDKSGKKT
ncbi:TetR family transcriptional regulator [Marinobacter sp. VGCF2001]|uniref:TetR family transcriptional regulator n=1 Tax=Marinobacter sp. VGCF2001 TaxID=3417189 RepID=UPI003CF36D09